MPLGHLQSWAEGETLGKAYAYYSTAKNLYQDRLGLTVDPVRWCGGMYCRVSLDKLARTRGVT